MGRADSRTGLIARYQSSPFGFRLLLASGTQQSQIASLQSSPVTNSQVSTAISSTTNTPQSIQTNYVNNQPSIKMSLWENFFHTIHSPNLSLITRLFLICYGVYFFVMAPLLSIYVIVIGIQGMNAFAIIMGGIGLWTIMYGLFIKKNGYP